LPDRLALTPIKGTKKKAAKKPVVKKVAPKKKPVPTTKPAKRKAAVSR
jgi:hypothetical protein